MQNCGQDGRGNDREARDEREEHGQNLSRLQVAFIAEHLMLPFNNRMRVLRSPETVLAPVEELPSDLMGANYVSSGFAKMSGVPDKLTETPHTYSRGGTRWKRSSRS
jgi:hypothetical protein